MKNIYWGKTYPYIIAIVLFTVVSFVYFSPVIGGKIIMGHDTSSWIAKSNEMRGVEAETGERQFWTNSMFGGMPTYQTQNYSGEGIIKYVFAALTIFPRPVFFLVLFLFGGFFMLRSFRVNPWLSIAGALLIAFASYNFIIIGAGHNTKAMVMAFAMPLIGGVALAYRGERILGSIITMLFLGLAVYANHVQILYYTLFILILFFIAELVNAIKEKKMVDLLKTTGTLVAAAIVGVSLSAASLLASYEYSRYTMRGHSNGLTIDPQSVQEGLSTEYITQWSYGRAETMTLLIPRFRGGSSAGMLPESSHTATRLRQMGFENQLMPLYWGTQPFTSGPVYVGAITVLLFVLGLFVVKGRDKWWLLSATILSILLAWGYNFLPLTQFFIDHVPLYNKFRAVSMILVIAGITMPLLALLALKNIFEGKVEKEKLMKSLAYSTGIVGGICALFWLFPTLAGNFVSPGDVRFSGGAEFLQTTLPLDRKEMLSNDAFRSLAFILLAASVLFFVAKSKLKAGYAIAILGVLFLLDLFPVAKRYLNNDHFIEAPYITNPHPLFSGTGSRQNPLFSPSFADKEILQDTTIFRVINLTVDPFNDASPSYFHHNVGGYSAVKLRRIQELINVFMFREVNDLITVLQSPGLTMEDIYAQFERSPALNMLNTRYFIINPNASPLVNPFAVGNAWLVDRIHFANSADEEMLALAVIDIHREMVMDATVERSIVAPDYSAIREFARNINAMTLDSLATIELISYSPMKLVYRFQSTTDQMAVFSEIYYNRGWRAYINGEKVPHIRANYLLRAMPLKAGEYEIIFRFEPTIIRIGNSIAVAASVIFVFTFAFLIGSKVRRTIKVKN